MNIEVASGKVLFISADLMMLSLCIIHSELTFTFTNYVDNPRL